MKYLFCTAAVFSLLGSSFADVDHIGQTAHLRAEAESKQQILEKVRRADAELTENQKRFDVLYYKLDLFPDAENAVLYGNVTMRAAALAELSSAELNFLSNMTIDSVVVNNQTAAFTHQDDLLVIRLDRVYQKDESFQTRVVYHGKPQSSGFGAFGFSSYAGKPMIWTLSEPFGARNWWPCKDAPADKADSVDLRVKVPADLIVASNGRLVSIENRDGCTIYNWQERYPIVTYLVSLAVYPYVTYSDWYVTEKDSMEVQFYVFADHLKSLRANYAKTVPMIRTFAELFGEYPFIQEKYGHAEFLWGGGMEHQTITSLGGWSESLIVHELSHQWWGDMITCETFHDIWLNEGFATYSEALWWEQQYGAKALHQDMAGKIYLGEETIYVENPLTDNVFYYATTYAKASWVLHMLRHVIGDDLFFQLLHRYYDEFKFKTINTKQFCDLCERVSGQDLEPFFQQWIHGRGAPFYTILWESTPSPSGGYDLVVSIKQKQVSDTIFQMPIDLTVQTEAGEHIVTVENRLRQEIYHLHVESRPLDVILDRDNWILKQVERIAAPLISLQSFQIIDDAGATLTRLPIGAPVHLFVELRNSGVSAQTVSASIVSKDERVVVLDGMSVFGDLPLGGSADNRNRPYRLQVKPETPGGLVELTLTVSYAGGVPFDIPLLIPMGAPTLLIVDDDDGAGFEAVYQAMAQQAKVNADTWTIKTQGVPNPEALVGYRHVLWFTADDRQTSLTTAEQQVIENYLSRGGRLLLTGRHIAADLMEDGSPEDVEFCRRVLNAKFLGDQHVNYAAVGVQTDPVGKGLAVRFSNVSGNNEIEPLGDAVAVMTYLPSGQTAALRHRNPVTDGCLVFFAFGLEEIVGPKETSAAQIVSNVLSWFNTAVSNVSEDKETVPTTLVLLQNAPNPFNPTTTVRYFMTGAALLEVTVHNVLGERVKRFPAEPITPGWHSFTWDGRAENGEVAAAGLYLLTVWAKSANKTEQSSVKMIKLN